MNYRSKFFDYALPSVGSLLVMGLYFVVDGIFVGQGVGNNGLAAVNLAVPYISILTAAATMISMGGATIASIALGERNQRRANKIFNTSIFTIVVTALIFVMFTYYFTDEIVCFLGANAALFDYTSIYIKYYVSFDIFFALSLALATFARNDGAPRLAFWAMIAGAVSNIFLDWLLIFGLHLGIKGAAVATGIGQIISCLILLPHFVRGKGELEFSLRYVVPAEIRQIIHTGLPECITQMSSPVTIFCYNLIIIEIFGENGVAAYAIVSYLLLIVFAIFIGIAEALQPLLSRSYGERNKIALTEFFKIGLKTNSFFAVIVYLFFLLFGKNIISIFTGDSNVIDLTYACICIYGISFMLAAFNIIYSTFFLATKKTDLAVKVAVLRGLVFNSICIFSVAWIFGQSGVWFGIVLAELLVLMYLYRQRLLKIPLTEL